MGWIFRFFLTRIIPLQLGPQKLVRLRSSLQMNEIRFWTWQLLTMPPGRKWSVWPKFEIPKLLSDSVGQREPKNVALGCTTWLWIFTSRTLIMVLSKNDADYKRTVRLELPTNFWPFKIHLRIWTFFRRFSTTPKFHIFDIFTPK